jgi:hypothetical protein
MVKASQEVGFMTQRPDAPLGFCQSCGAKCLVSGQTHCASCGQKLIQLGEHAAAAGPAAGAPTSVPAPAPWAGPAATTTAGEGDCGDYSSLFVALARAKGIPARHIVGSWAESGADQVHVWAEFYLEGLGWISVDPTVGQSSNQPDSCFGRIGNDRVILGKGLNLALSPAAPGNAVADHLQTYHWWFWGTSGDPKSMSANRSWTVEPIG